jgi:hypothetical protein
MSRIQFISTHRIEMAKEEGAYMLLTQLPVLYLTSEKGLELMRESGEPMEFGILDYSKVFSRAFGERGNGASGDLNGSRLDEIVTYLGFRFAKSGASRWMLVNNLDHGYFVSP